MLDRGLFRHKLAGPILQLLPDCTNRLGFVQAVKMNPRRSTFPKILALHDCISGASSDGFLNIVCNRREYLVNIPTDVCTTGIAKFK